MINHSDRGVRGGLPCRASRSFERRLAAFLRLLSLTMACRVCKRPTILTEFKEPPGLFQSRLERFGKEIFGL